MEIDTINYAKIAAEFLDLVRKYRGERNIPKLIECLSKAAEIYEKDKRLIQAYKCYQNVAQWYACDYTSRDIDNAIINIIKAISICCTLEEQTDQLIILHEQLSKWYIEIMKYSDARAVYYELERLSSDAEDKYEYQLLIEKTTGQIINQYIMKENYYGALQEMNGRTDIFFVSMILCQLKIGMYKVAHDIFNSNELLKVEYNYLEDLIIAVASKDSAKFDELFALASIPKDIINRTLLKRIKEDLKINNDKN